MELTCDSCSNRIVIPDGKIPKRKKFSLACPVCRNKIVIDPIIQAASSELDFVGVEDKIALVCDEIHKDIISPVLSSLGYLVRVAETSEEALTHMRFTLYSLVVIDENFGSSAAELQNIPLKQLQSIPMHNRRNMFVILLSDKVKTLSRMDAYTKSVNLVLNYADMDKLSLVIKNGLKDNNCFYKVFKESLVKLGKD